MLGYLTIKKGSDDPPLDITIAFYNLLNPHAFSPHESIRKGKRFWAIVYRTNKRLLRHGEKRIGNWEGNRFDHEHT